MKKLLFLLLLFILLSSTSYSQFWVQTLNGTAMWSMYKDIQNNIYAGTSGTIKAIYKTSNNGQNWVEILSNGVSNFLSISVDSTGNIYAANVSNGMMKSTNGGGNWTNVPSSTFNGKNVQTVACGKNGFVYVGCVTGGVFKSTDYGATFPENDLSTASIVTLAVDKYNPDIIYAGASSTTGVTGFFISTNSGTNFSGPYNSYNCWGVIQTSQQTLYMVTTSTGSPFSKSTNGGYNWTTISSQPGSMRGCTDFRTSYLAISGNGGVFISTNYGASFNATAMTYSANQIVTSGNNKLFVAASGTTYAGVWIYTDLTKITPIGNEVAVKYELEQNYPNPFNSSTVIKFSIPKDEFVELKVFDITGKEINTLINSDLKAGKYSFMFDAKNYTSGIYMYRLKTNNNMIIRKMILVK